MQPCMQENEEEKWPHNSLKITTINISIYL